MAEHLCKRGPNGTPCRRVRVGQAFDDAQDCWHCWLFAHDEKYNRYMGGDGKVASAPSTPVATVNASAPARLLLGDAVEAALSKIGITKELVSEWMGRPCSCPEKKEKLNNLHRWAENAAKETADKARALLGKLIGRLF